MPLLMLLLACDGSAPPAEPAPSPAPVPTPAPAPQAAPDKASLLAAGLCSDDGTIQEMQAVTLSDGRKLLELTCAMYAYQGTFSYAWADSGEPVRDQDGNILSLLGWPGLDTETGALAWLSKARGVGDCGDYFVYQLEGDRFVQKEHRSRGCDNNADEVPPPDQWPLAGSGIGHCTGGEVAYFSCATSATKVLSLCGGSGSLQYRFGPVGAPELAHPANSAASAFTVGTKSYPQFQAETASVANGDVTYEIHEASGAGGPNAETNNFVGVYVFEGEELLASVSCSGDVTSDWAALQSASQ